MLLRYSKGHFYQVNCKWGSYYRRVIYKRRKEVSLLACKMYHKNEKKFQLNTKRSILFKSLVQMDDFLELCDSTSMSNRQYSLWPSLSSLWILPTQVYKNANSCRAPGIIFISYSVHILNILTVIKAPQVNLDGNC